MIHNREVDLSRLSETQLSELSLFELQRWYRINRGPVPRQYNKNDLIIAIRRTATDATLVPSTASSTDGLLSEDDYSAMTLDQLNQKRQTIYDIGENDIEKRRIKARCLRHG